MNKLIIAIAGLLIFFASVSAYVSDATHIESSVDISSNEVSELSK